MQKVVDVIDLIETFKDKEDGTYSIITKENVVYPNGYQVSFVRPEAFQQLDRQNWDNLTNYFCEYFNSAAHIGVYCGSAEVSFHCVPITKALNIMETYNQESILDWKQKNKHPDSIECWFIMNRYFDENKVIDYGEVLESI